MGWYDTTVKKLLHMLKERMLDNLSVKRAPFVFAMLPFQVASSSYTLYLEPNIATVYIEHSF
jgi:hypothetical protein